MNVDTHTHTPERGLTETFQMYNIKIESIQFVSIYNRSITGEKIRHGFQNYNLMDVRIEAIELMNLLK